MCFISVNCKRGDLAFGLISPFFVNQAATKKKGSCDVEKCAPYPINIFICSLTGGAGGDYCETKRKDRDEKSEEAHSQKFWKHSNQMSENLRQLI